jgi:allantoin racemase
MAIRIWHQSWTVLSDLGAYDEALTQHFKRICRPGTEVVLHGMLPGSYRSNYPGVDIRHVGMQFLHSMQIIRAGVQARNEGFDAYAISTLPDPALREVRALIDIPVVGYGEAAMLTACLLGRKFSILCFISELADLLTENARRYGLQERLAGVSDVGFRFQDVLAGFDDPKVLIERFTAAARKEIERGADVIIPGEAPLCVLLAKHGVSSIDGVPILDSLSCWVKQAEMLVDLKRQSNITACRRGFYHELPDADRLAEVMDFYKPAGMN